MAQAPRRHGPAALALALAAATAPRAFVAPPAHWATPPTAVSSPGGRAAAAHAGATRPVNSGSAPGSGGPGSGAAAFSCGAVALGALAAMRAPRRGRRAAALPLRAAPAAWRGHGPLQSTLPVRADGSVDYEDVDRSPVSRVFTDTFRGLLTEVTGHTTEVPGFDGMMDLVRRMNDMGGTAEAMQQRALGLFQNVLPELHAGWVPGFWKSLVQPKLPPWVTSYAFVKICQNFFPWLMGPMQGDEYVDVRVPEYLRAVFFFLPEFVSFPQTAKAERCRFLENAQCASICVNICKAPSQAWLGEDFGMPVHIEPNYDDFSCRWRFGVEPPPLMEDEAVMVPCFKKCPSKTKGERDALSVRERLRAEGARALNAGAPSAADEADAGDEVGSCMAEVVGGDGATPE